MISRFRTALKNARKQSGANTSSSPSGGYMTRSRAATISTLANPIVEHDPENSEFFIDIGKHKAFIEYKKVDNVIQMEHTEVPVVFEGKGFGKILAKFAFEYCVENELKMQLNCTFLQHYLDKYAPEYTAHVVNTSSK